jgi:hypothetical protein
MVEKPERRNVSARMQGVNRVLEYFEIVRGSASLIYCASSAGKGVAASLVALGTYRAKRVVSSESAFVDIVPSFPTAKRVLVTRSCADWRIDFVSEGLAGVAEVSKDVLLAALAERGYALQNDGTIIIHEYPGATGSTTGCSFCVEWEQQPPSFIGLYEDGLGPYYAPLGK